MFVVYLTTCTLPRCSMDKAQVGCREENHGDIERDPHLQVAIMEVVENQLSQ